MDWSCSLFLCGGSWCCRLVDGLILLGVIWRLRLRVLGFFGFLCFCVWFDLAWCWLVCVLRWLRCWFVVICPPCAGLLVCGFLLVGGFGLFIGFLVFWFGGFGIIYFLIRFLGWQFGVGFWAVCEFRVSGLAWCIT